MISQLKTSIEKISNTDIKTAIFTIIAEAPKYFWNTPASSTGKYHPAFATGSDGLQKHTAAAMEMVVELSRTYGLSVQETDICLAAMALHDTTKYGLNEEMDYTYFQVHPYTVRPYYDNVKGKPLLVLPIQILKKRGLWDPIMKCVEKHMGSMDSGEWNPMGLKPETPMEIVVHLSDYIASRKGISFDMFDTEVK